VNTGRKLVETLGQLHIRLVGGYRKADVSKPIELLAYRLGYCRMAMTGIHHTDPTTEIDQPIAVRIGDDRAFGVDYGDRSD
jgi:hypothetical protein